MDELPDSDSPLAALTEVSTEVSTQSANAVTFSCETPDPMANVGDVEVSTTVMEGEKNESEPPSEQGDIDIDPENNIDSSGPSSKAVPETDSDTVSRGEKRSIDEVEESASNNPYAVEWVGPTVAKISFCQAESSLCLSGRGSVCLRDGIVWGHGFLLQPDIWYVFECPRWSSWLVLDSASPTAQIEIKSRAAGGFAEDQDILAHKSAPHGPSLPPHLEEPADNTTLSATFSIHNIDDAQSRPTLVLPAWHTTADTIIDTLKRTSSEKNQGAKSRSCVVAVAGAKGVGKSTLVRYLLHRFLSDNQQAFVLDGDTGQAEFGPPGLLTLTHLTRAQPLWSLPHHHMLTGKAGNPLVPSDAKQTAIFFGGTSSQLDPGRYLQSLAELMERYKTSIETANATIPLIVNLDGWVKGLGYQVLSTFLTTHTPSHVIQIVGTNATQQIDVFPIVQANPAATVVHTLHSYRSVSHRNVSPALSVPASAWRDLRFVHYWLDEPDFDIKFSQNELISDQDGYIAKRLTRLAPYLVPWEAVACRDVDGANITPELLNGCIVGLCCNSKPENLPTCVGLGIVRSVDVAKRLFFVLTPVEITALREVQTFSLGYLSLPLECLALGVRGSCFPFLMETMRMNRVTGSDPMRSRNTIQRKATNS